MAGKRKSQLFVAGVTSACVVVAGSGITVAATGASLSLGHRNVEHATTALANLGSGPALSLSTRSKKTPPLAVSNATQIPKLNASELGGRTARQFQSAFRRIVVVHPGKTDVASGHALRAAVASIKHPTATEPEVVFVEPGRYDLGAKTLALPAGVDLEGAGQDVTQLFVHTQSGASVVGLKVASGAVLADFSISVGSNAAGSTGVAVVAEGALEMSDASVSAEAGHTTVALLLKSSDAVFDGLRVTAFSFDSGGTGAGISAALASVKIEFNYGSIDATPAAVSGSGTVLIADSMIEGTVSGASGQVSCAGDYDLGLNPLNATCG